MDDDEVVVARQRQHVVGGARPAGGPSIEAATLDQAAGCASQVGYQKERIRACLVAGAGAAVEAVEGRRLEEQRPHHQGFPCCSVIRPVPLTR